MARIKRLYGETVAMTTTAAHLAAPIGYGEIKHKASAAYRLGLAPLLAKVFYYKGSTGVYTDYTAYARDKSSDTHVPLDAMLVADIIYMGFPECPRGVYFDVGTNVNANAATLDMEYCYDAAQKGYIKLTGTVSGALTVDETVTGGTSGTTATMVLSGATYIIVKDASGAFTVGETVSGTSHNVSVITAITNEAEGTGYFTDVASDSDGTNTATETLSQDGVYTFTLPDSIPCTVNGVSQTHWIRFYPSATLSATLDINEIIPACPDVNYGFFEAGIEYQYQIDLKYVGSIETAMASGSDTLRVTWIRT